MAKKKLIAEKYVSALPGVLVADTLYCVRNGAGFDLYLTNSAGPVVAYQLNAPAADPALVSAVIRAGRYASPSAIKMQGGLYYDNAFHAAATASVTLPTNTVELVPMFFNSDVTVDRIGTVSGSNSVKYCIYTTDADNLPKDLFWSFSGFPTNTNGYRHAVLDPALTIPAGSYWLGTWAGASNVMTGSPTANMCNLGLALGESTAYYTKIRKFLNFASGSLPDPWVFSASELTTGVPFLMRWRVA
jgi:hypothetical protein